MERKMNALWYCPNCHYELRDGDNSTRCTWCNADSLKSPGWLPVTEKSTAQVTATEPLTLPEVLFSVIFRLTGGALVWVLLAALAISSAIPYGGGSAGLFQLAFAATFFIPLWAIWPVAKYIFILFKKKNINQ
jgi:hypothetical protein